MRTHPLDTVAAASAADHYTNATGVACTVIDVDGGLVYPRSLDTYPCRLCRLIHATELTAERAAAPHLDSVGHADRFGGHYVFMCESSFTHWTSPIKAGDRVIGALVAGPVLTVEDAAFFDEEIIGALDPAFPATDRKHLQSLFEEVPRVLPARVTSLAHLLSMVAAQLSTPEGSPFAESAARLARESRLNEYIQELKERRITIGRDPDSPSYPIEKEGELLRAIEGGDVEAAQRILNELLGHVFFTSGADLEVLKHRSRELVVLLSRATIARGAETDRVFGLNYQFLDGLESRADVNEIAHWMSRIVRRFADFVFTVPRGAAHFGAMRRVVAHIHRNYRQRLTLERLAGVAGLSAAYLSRLFHREMGEPLSRFVVRVRVEKARDLLAGTAIPIADVADYVGFVDQSHLTRAFKSVTGETPGAFRAHTASSRHTGGDVQ
ncbi:MAG: helix-turn-helix domain-containing protein [bacterium]